MKLAPQSIWIQCLLQLITVKQLIFVDVDGCINVGWMYFQDCIFISICQISFLIYSTREEHLRQPVGINKKYKSKYDFWRVKKLFTWLVWSHSCRSSVVTPRWNLWRSCCCCCCRPSSWSPRPSWYCHWCSQSRIPGTLPSNKVFVPPQNFQQSSFECVLEKCCHFLSSVKRSLPQRMFIV